MAKIDSPEFNNFLLNPAAFETAKTETKKARNKPVIPGRKTRFSTLLESAREEASSELGPLQNLPVSEETVNLLLDEVRSAGGNLKDRPFPDEILCYKKAVRNFMHYVVENGFTVKKGEGVPNGQKPGYKGPLWDEKAKERKGYLVIQVVDKKLEDMAAMILSSQMSQIELASRLEEITGILVDLMQ
jgi:uncharacterized protein YaaR (DUF327 family)